jgi:protein involved in polysaccharide export with SLBB domain
MRNMKLLLGIACGIIFSSRLAAQEIAAPATLQPGDTLRITVLNRPELTGAFGIGSDGAIRHPLYRTAVVAGIPLNEVERRVGEALDRFLSSPQFVVEPLLRVSVGGEVRRPGLFALPPETTLAQAVALAGGVTEAGRVDRILLLRGGTSEYLDLSSAHGGLAQSLIHSGDQLYVRRRGSVFRDYVAPAASVVAALGTVLRLLIN